MRLIDADAANTCEIPVNFDYIETAYIQEWIGRQPTIDPVHAAGGCYCRECKYFRYQNTIPNKLKNYPANYGRCKYMDWAKTDDNFCSRGKRREGDSNV